ncbi:hypothetical protein BWX40_06060 [Prevotella intermedia]|nr:hypothetical protein BWX40_06060 [Prevotella intermedia]
MCTFAHVIEVLTKKTKVTKRAEIQIRILALNFYITKMFTGQQYHTKYFTERAEWGIQHRHSIKRGRVKLIFDTPSSLF